ncbi:MAG: phosphodiester glycosidase family protein [Armatimonadota bacterium]
MVRYRCWLLVAVFLLGGVGFQATAQPVLKDIAPGVTLIQDVRTDPGSPLIINCVRVDLENPDVVVKAALGRDVVIADGPTKGREAVSSLTYRTGAAVGVNADFFPFTGDPLGVCIIDGELVSEPAGNRAAFALTSERRAFFDTPKMSAVVTGASGAQHPVAGINRPLGPGEIVVYTSKFGSCMINSSNAVHVVCTSEDLPVRVNVPLRLTVREIVAGGVTAPASRNGVLVSGSGGAGEFLKSNVSVGDVITLRFDIQSPNGFDWTNVLQAVGGGPWLLRDGKPWIDTVAEGFSVTGFEKARHPRTAVGLTRDSKLLLVTVDGRQTISVGVSLQDLAELMMKLAAVSAINLDGGGSTTLSVRGILVNAPSGGIEREVSNALLVFAPVSQLEELPKLGICGLGPEVVSGKGVGLSLVWGDDASAVPDERLSSVIWGTKGGIGFVSQKGYFVPVKARKGSVYALYGVQMAETAVTVCPGPPAKLIGELIPDPANPLRCVARVTAVDVNENPVPSCQVSLAVVGGTAECSVGLTDERGIFEAGITWDAKAQLRQVSARSNGLTAQIKPK